MPTAFYISSSTFAGFDPDAFHYYGELKWYDENRKYHSEDMVHPITQKEATRMNKSDRGAKWKKGEMSERFESEKDLLAHAIKKFEKISKPGDVLFKGNIASGDPLRVLAGPEDFIEKGNLLRKEAEEIDFYEKFPDKMEIIYQRWVKLKKEFNIK